MDGIRDQKKSYYKIKLAVNIVLLCAFIALIGYATVRYAPDVTRLMSEPDKLDELLASYGHKGVLVFIFFQFVQVLIAAIPGEIVQIAGGYVFGTLQGTVYSIVGILIGYIADFFIARFLGYRLIKIFISPEKIEKFQNLMNSKKSEILTFVLFLIPGLPKDMLVYVAGLTPVKPERFITLAMIARLPALIGSSYIGANLQKENYITATVVTVLAVIFFAGGLLLKDRIIEKLKSILNK